MPAAEQEMYSLSAFTAAGNEANESRETEPKTMS